MPHSGRIRKTICEGLAYVDLNTMLDDIINSLSKDEINNLKAYYKREDFKNSFGRDLRNFDFNIYSEKPIQNEDSFFEIIKLEKHFKTEKYKRITLLEALLPKKKYHIQVF